MPYVTPLLAFLRCLTKPQRKEFAAECGTTELYLYQIAAQHEPNPRLRLAREIVQRSQPWARKVMTRPLTFDDLLIGVPPDDESDAPGPD